MNKYTKPSIELFGFKRLSTMEAMQNFIKSYLWDNGGFEYDYRSVACVEPIAYKELLDGKITDIEYKRREEAYIRELERKYPPIPKKPDNLDYKGARHVEKPDVLTKKIQFVCHQLISRITGHITSAEINVTDLRKAGMWNDADHILNKLRLMGLITIDKAPVKDKNSTFYSFGEDSQIFRYKCDDPDIIDWCRRLEDLLNEKKSKAIYQAEMLYGKDFVTRYNRCLAMLHVDEDKKNDMQKAISLLIEENEKAKAYYSYIETSLEQRLFLTSVDEQGRMYSLLTNLKRGLKQYLNIKHLVDCSNSHPVLFNHILLKIYGYNNKQSLLLINVIKEYINTLNIKEYCINNNIIYNNNLSYKEKYLFLYHYVELSLYKYLKINLFETGKAGELPRDVVNYVTLTSLGIFWDYIVEVMNNVDRDTVKQDMFKEVFYSWRSKQKDREYAQVFKAQFPNVYKVIAHFKKPMKYPDVMEFLTLNSIDVDKNPATSLSRAMMSIESQIFVKVLKHLYEKNYKATHIHDCIVIIDHPNNAELTRQMVVDEMLKVYGSYGLSPSFGDE